CWSSAPASCRATCAKWRSRWTSTSRSAIRARTAVIALTHDPKLDDLALIDALQTPAFYVGALGSRANHARRVARLREHFGLTPAQLARLRGPAG
ncbi:XdhC family protein, partial [Bordetella pertussis]|uniref:XdhC family protein n=1 Tax=Bordetella pertussis TaxID=520 RepID=UPI0018A6BDDC